MQSGGRLFFYCLSYKVQDCTKFALPGSGNMVVEFTRDILRRLTFIVGPRQQRFGAALKNMAALSMP